MKAHHFLLICDRHHRYVDACPDCRRSVAHRFDSTVTDRETGESREVWVVSFELPEEEA